MRAISTTQRILNLLKGDYWDLESNGTLWGVKHPWRWHTWRDFKWTYEQARIEQDLRNNHPYYDWRGNWIDPRLEQKAA